MLESSDKPPYRSVNRQLQDIRRWLHTLATFGSPSDYIRSVFDAVYVAVGRVHAMSLVDACEYNHWHGNNKRYRAFDAVHLCNGYFSAPSGME